MTDFLLRFIFQRTFQLAQCQDRGLGDVTPLYLNWKVLKALWKCSQRVLFNIYEPFL